ncbi:hypothetical protein EIP91_004727 [Steccherinum ochraceum]|uniref:RING-type domain-containing protein n=1 Tax=Steccherinum ochraceum TaxID=92696 RepID=A0A4R0RJK3_9APHY|nr:hypothetical protein EIP91_004727 [Steccherinum ochraceum]
MRPKTRSAAKAKSVHAESEGHEDASVSRRRAAKGRGTGTDEDGDDSDGDNLLMVSFENHLKKVNSQFLKLKKEYAALKEKNEELTRDLNTAREMAVENEAQPKRGKKAGPSVTSLQKEVEGLKQRIEKLQKAEKKDKKLIKQLRQKEVKKEAEYLQDDADDTLEVDDSAHKLRKLLRAFKDLMMATSLEDGEDCDVCYDRLQVDGTVCFPCEHLLCEDCFQKLPGPNKDEWDELLKIANKFAVMDHQSRGVLDTSEEEEEENFLDDDESVTASTEPNPEGSASHLLSTSPEPEGTVPLFSEDVPTTPKKKRLIASSDVSSDVERKEDHEKPVAGPSNGAEGSPSYALSPAAEKRRKMEELAEARAQKRQRR